MRTLLELIDTLGKWAAAFSVVLVYGIAVLIIAEVFSRWVLGISLSFAWEFSAYFFATAVFCGAAYTMRTGGHVRVALFRGFLSARGQLAMDVLATLVGAAITIFAASAMIQFAWRSFSRGSVSPTIDATPLVIPQGAVAFGLTLLALQMVARLIRLLTGAPPEDEETRESFNVE